MLMMKQTFLFAILVTMMKLKPKLKKSEVRLAFELKREGRSSVQIQHVEIHPPEPKLHIFVLDLTSPLNWL